MVGELRDAQAGEDTEGEDRGDERGRGREVARSNRYAEIGEDPEGVGSEVRFEPDGELIELGLGQAVEEEVGDDEVVRAGGLEAAGVGGWVLRRVVAVGLAAGSARARGGAWRG